MAEVNYAEIFKQILEQLKPGGVMEQAQLADIKTGKKRAISKAKGGLISSGLSGTTLMGAAPIAAEEGAARSRLAVKAAGTQAYTGALGQFAALTEQSRQAELERAAAMDRTRLLLQSQEAQQMRGIQAGQQTTGLDVFGKPMAGSLAETQAAYMKSQMTGTGGATAGGATPSAQSFPSLYGGKGTTAGNRLGMPGSIIDGSSGTSGGSSWAPGEFAGSFNGERYVYNAQGQIVKESEAALGVGRTESAQTGIEGGMQTGGEQYPTMQEAYKQGVGAMGRDYKGSVYQLTANGWVLISNPT